MSYLTEQASYLKGLYDGGDIDTSSKEGKLINALISLVGDMADEIQELTEELDEMQGLVDEIDEALGDVEDDLYGYDDEEDEDWDFDDDDEFALECPNCGDTIYLDPALLEGDDRTVVCPNCKEEIELEISDDCDCGCED